MTKARIEPDETGEGFYQKKGVISEKAFGELYEMSVAEVESIKREAEEDQKKEIVEMIKGIEVPLEGESSWVAGSNATVKAIIKKIGEYGNTRR